MCQSPTVVAARRAGEGRVEAAVTVWRTAGEGSMAGHGTEAWTGRASVEGAPLLTMMSSATTVPGCDESSLPNWTFMIPAPPRSALVVWKIRVPFSSTSTVLRFPATMAWTVISPHVLKSVPGRRQDRDAFPSTL